MAVFSVNAQLVKNLSEMRETLVQSLGWEDPLEKEMATHSSTLAWRIPWREESMGLQRVGHDLESKKPESYISSDWFTELAEKGTSRSDKSSGE